MLTKLFRKDNVEHVFMNVSRLLFRIMILIKLFYHQAFKLGVTIESLFF